MWVSFTWYLFSATLLDCILVSEKTARISDFNSIEATYDFRPKFFVIAYSAAIHMCIEDSSTWGSLFAELAFMENCLEILLTVASEIEIFMLRSSQSYCCAPVCIMLWLANQDL